jgi:hypothetical protein
MVAYITPQGGITQRFALHATEREEGIREAHRLAVALFKHGFTFIVREA